MSHTSAPATDAAALRSLIDAFPGVALRCRIDEARTLEFASEGCLHLLGQPATELVGNPAGLLGLVVAEDRPLVRRVVAEALAAGEPWELSYAIRRKDGAVRRVIERGRGVGDAAGRATGTEGWLTDDSRLYAARAQVVEKERLVQAIFEQTAQFIGLLDREGRVLRANRASLAAAGLRPADVVGLHFWDTPWWRGDPDSRERVRAAVHEAAHGGIARCELAHTLADGTVAHHDFTLSPVRDEQGVVVALIPEGHDITARRQAALALRESEEKLARAFAASPDAISITDFATGRFIDVNEGFERLFEWPRDEVIGRSSLDLRMWASEPDRQRLLAQLSAGGRVRDFVAVGRARSGRLARCLIAGEVAEISGARAIILVIRDVTEQARAEQALRESEERMRLIIENAPEAIVVLDATAGGFVEVNAQAEKLFHAPRAQLLGRSPVDFSPEMQPDGRSSREAAREYITAAMAGGRPVFGWTHRTAEGVDVPCEVRLLRLPNPEAVLLRGSIADLRERQRIEHAFQALLEGTAGATGQALFDTTVARLARELQVRGAALIEFDGARVPPWGRSLARWIDGPAAPCEGGIEGTVLEAVLRQPYVHHARAAASAGDACAFFAGVVPEGLLAMPLLDRGGAPLGILAVFHDRPMPASEAMRLLLAASAARVSVEIQHRRGDEAIHRLNADLERRVTERTAQLAAANAELESFSYSVSHDLRSPLRAIDGFSRALEEDFGGVLDDEGRDFIRRIRAASQRMGLLIDDLLRLSRAARVEMRRERVDLSALALGIAAELRQRDPEREVGFDCEPGLVVVADRALAAILLTNLLENAWKYTRRVQAARIRFARATVGLLPGEAFAAMVSDNGAGFDMRYVGKLFAPFQRLHGPSEFEGTGIGLATVRRIVARHGGRAWIEGAVGQGATAYFTLGEAAL